MITTMKGSTSEALTRISARRVICSVPFGVLRRIAIEPALPGLQAEAVADLIESENEAAYQVALQQMRGGFSNEIAKLREELINFASLIELELDFAEEDVEFADRSRLTNLVEEILGVVDSLIQSFALGNAIKQGVNTVIAGRPKCAKI